MSWFCEAHSNETCSGIVLGEGEEAVKNRPHGHSGRHPTDAALHTKNALGCCSNHCTIMAVTSLSDQNLWPLSAFLRGPNTWQSDGDRSELYREWSYLPTNAAQHALNSTGHMGDGHCLATWWHPSWACQNVLCCWWHAFPYTVNTVLWHSVSWQPLASKNWMTACWSSVDGSAPGTLILYCHTVPICSDVPLLSYTM